MSFIFSGCLFGKRADITAGVSGDDGSGDDGSGGASLTIADLATNPSHSSGTTEAYASACFTSTELTSINGGTSQSYYDLLDFSPDGQWSYQRLWYEGTDCYLSSGDANANGVPDEDTTVEIGLSGTASIVENVSGSKFIIQLNNTNGSTLSLTYGIIKNWYTGACTNGPSFTYTSDSDESRSMNGINCTPWGKFPSNASGDDGKLFNVIQKVSDNEFQLGALLSNQRGPGVNKSTGSLDPSVTPSETFTRYTY